MLDKLQSNIFTLLNAYVVRKYNSTLKGFTVLLTPRSLCSGFGLSSHCPWQIEKLPSLASSFQIPSCASLHRINTQVIFKLSFFLFFFQLLLKCHRDAVAQPQCLNKCTQTLHVRGLAARSYFCARF